MERETGFVAHKTGLGARLGPDHDGGFGLAQGFEDDLVEIIRSDEFGVPPHAIAARLEVSREAFGQRPVGAGIRDENVGHGNRHKAYETEEC